MSKSSQELFENKIKNPIYCEIIYKINTREVFLFEFEKEFNKDRVTLLKQINELEKDNFIIRRKEGRKQLFSINWEKITEEFVNFVKELLNKRYQEIKMQEKGTPISKKINDLETRYKKVEKYDNQDEIKPIIKNIKNSINKSGEDNKKILEYLINLKSKKEYWKELSKNDLLKSLFKHLFSHYNYYKYYSNTIYNLFENINLNSADFKDTFEYYLKHYGVKDVMKIKGIEQVKKIILLFEFLKILHKSFLETFSLNFLAMESYFEIKKVLND